MIDNSTQKREYILVRLWGVEMGVLIWEPKTWNSYFCFCQDWKRRGLDIAPIIYPLEKFPEDEEYKVRGSKSGFFGRLPHFLSDFMPKFRHVHGIKPDPAQRLLLAEPGTTGAYTFEYLPQEGIVSDWSKQYTFDDPVIAKHLTMRGRSHKSFVVRNGVEYLRKESPSARDEYVYYLMATEAGIHMMNSFYERGAFYTQRFDKMEDGTPLFAQTLASLDPKALSYSSLLEVCKKLNLGEGAVEQCLRLLVFNTLALNDDDNSRNFSFLMTPDGRWSFAPAYDLTYCHDPKNPQGPNKYRLKHDISLVDIPSDYIRDVKAAIEKYGSGCF